MSLNKVALCLSGHPRFYKTGYDCFEKNLFKHYDVDVFFHMWFDRDKLGDHGTYGTLPLDENADSESLRLYQPKKCVIESQVPVYYDRHQAPNGVNVFSQYSMFYGIMMANMLKSRYEDENGFKYDVVIRSRFDTGLLQTLELNDNFDNIVYDINSHSDDDTFRDWLFYSSSENMDKLCDAFKNLNEFKPKLSTFAGEGIIMMQTNHVGLEKVTHNISVPGDNVVLIRGDREGPECWKYYGDIHV